MTQNAAPLVSVVIATYNRSHLLRHAVRSVLDSTLRDLELIVVGDACTDDTAEVVAAFADPRVRFHNLSVNHGQQSGPNNAGVGMARGRYLAFLNHDDLFFPDHLAACVAHLEATGADLVWSPIAAAAPVGEADLRAGNWRFYMTGVPRGDAFDPYAFVVASSWLMRRELAGRVGEWRPSHETYVSPSQEWLFRAWRGGARLVFLPRVTVLAVYSGARPGSYTRGESLEHEVYAAHMRNDPQFRERVLQAAALGEARELQLWRHNYVFRKLRALLFGPLTYLAGRLGFHPVTPLFMLRFGRRGGFIRHIRRVTGLKP